MGKRKIRYATQSEFKREEVQQVIALPIHESRSGKDIPGSDLFDIDFYDVPLTEPLERDMITMVRHKAMSAYRGIMAPCVVEHAGLILEGYESQSFPGGLTQPMWDALGPENFVKSVAWAGKRAIARAVVGYCDGMKIHWFIGETSGSLVNSPRGTREFYWDTIFCPDGGGDLTYAEIAASDLARKVQLSQSTKAMQKLLEYIVSEASRMFAEY
jgi:XTP/dITP diphosphohydrolase